MPDQSELEATSGRTITGQWKELLTSQYVEDWTGKADGVYQGQGNSVLPSREDVFRAFAECPFDRLRAVIVGKAPYDDGQANGLAFSTSQEGSIPPSLWIIFSKIIRDVCPSVDYENGDLGRWATQGVLLLNSRLTIGHNGNSIKWGSFTNRVIGTISERANRPIVFMLWGKDAIKKRKYIDEGTHMVLRSSHPSPKSAFRGVGGQIPFINCEHFCEANEFLGDRAICWE